MLQGLAAGAFYLTTPQYTSEIAEKEIRGILGSFLQLLISLGVLFVYLIGSYLPVFWLNVTCGICPLIYASIFIFMPESPFYLIMKNREKEAEKALKALRDENHNIQGEINELKELFNQNEEKISFKKAIKQKSSVSALIIGCGLLFFRHMSCIIPILFYATMIFEVIVVNFRLMFKNRKFLPSRSLELVFLLTIPQ